MNDTVTLAENLLPIAGRRMMAYLSKTPDLLEEISRINPALTQYLENLVIIFNDQLEKKSLFHNNNKNQ